MAIPRSRDNRQNEQQAGSALQSLTVRESIALPLPCSLAYRTRCLNFLEMFSRPLVLLSLRPLQRAGTCALHGDRR